jgi:hypothetical protein
VGNDWERPSKEMMQRKALAAWRSGCRVCLKIAGSNPDKVYVRFEKFDALRCFCSFVVKI